MNSLRGKISEIKVNGSLSLVSIRINKKVTFKTIIIETPETVQYLKINHDIKVLFKETEVVIGTDTPHAISLQNRIRGAISKIEKGELISKIIIKTDAGEIASIISTNAVEELELAENKTVMTMVKLNEIMLSE